MKLRVWTIAFFAFASQAAFGASGVGPAGCGLGHQLFRKDNQVLAATTNGTSWNQTFGISSGTSGCAQDQKMAQMIMFVETNRIALANEVVRGRGETVTALSDLLGCSDSALLGDELKSRYGEIFAGSVNSIEISNSIKSAIGTSTRLAGTCGFSS